MGDGGGFDGKLSPPGGPLPPTQTSTDPAATAPAPAAAPSPPMAALGLPAAQWGPYAGMTQTHSLAIASLVCGIGALPLGCCCSLASTPLAVAAIACGIVALGKIRSNPEIFTGTAPAVVGIVLGAVALGYVVLTMVLGFGLQLFDRFGRHI